MRTGCYCFWCWSDLAARLFPLTQVVGDTSSIHNVGSQWVEDDTREAQQDGNWWGSYVNRQDKEYIQEETRFFLGQLLLWRQHFYHAGNEGYDLFQPKTSTFSTRALIWVHFETVHWVSQLIFSLFSHLKNALHNLAVELCSALKIFQKYSTVIY